MGTPASLDVVACDQDNVVVIWRKALLVQVRKGELTTELLVRLERVLRGLVAADRPFGALLVVEPGAKVPSEEARYAQRATMSAFGSRANVRAAAVMLGDGLEAALNRSAGRLVALGDQRIQRFEDVAVGAAWLAQELTTLGMGIGAKDILAIVEQCRALAPQPPAG